jgi:hypothetical protein
MTSATKQRHDCGVTTGHRKTQDNWVHCCVCNGRMHLEGCTSRKDKNKDCCPARHKMLHDAGQVRGIADDSMAMWSSEHPEGYHDPVKSVGKPLFLTYTIKFEGDPDAGFRSYTEEIEVIIVDSGDPGGLNQEEFAEELQGFLAQWFEGADVSLVATGGLV